MASSPIASEATRSPTIRIPLPVAVPTTALLDARRKSFYATKKAFAANDYTDLRNMGVPMTEEFHEEDVSKEHVGSSTHSSAYTTTTTAPSSTPSPNAVVMDTLVRRFRATESRLDRWRHSGGDSRTAAATKTTAVRLRKQRTHNHEKTNGERGKVAASPLNSLRHGLVNTSQYVMNGVLERSAVAHVVHSRWKHTWRRHTTTASAAAAATGKRPASTRVQRPRNTEERRKNTSCGPASWLRRAGRHFFGELSHSLALSSDRGQSSRVEVAGAAGRCHTHSTHNMEEREEGDYCDSRSGSHYSNSEDWNEVLSTDRVYKSADQKAPTTTLLHSAAASLDGHTPQLPPSLSSSDDEGSSDSSEEGGNHHNESERRAIHSVSPPFLPPTVDDDRFTLSWIRGLRHRNNVSAGGALASLPSAAQAVDVAEESFRRASRLLAKSRARFARWLVRQRRLQAAKRALLSPQWRRRFSRRRRGGADERIHDFNPGGIDEQRPSAIDGATNASTQNRADLVRRTSALERTILQRVPSTWEQALPETATAITGTGTCHDGNADRPTQAAERALVRAALQRAIAAATASRNLQEKNKTEEESNNGTTSSHKDVPTSTPLPRAAQREREHADAVSRLGESVRALASLRASARTSSSTLLGEDDHAAAALPNPHAGATPTILLSRHPSYLNRICSDGDASIKLRSQHEAGRKTKSTSIAAATTTATASTFDETNAFRSFLVDTTHTPHDTAVRLVYEEVMREVCSAQVRQEVDAVMDMSHRAADRALSQWVERQVLSELANLSNTTSQGVAEGIPNKSSGHVTEVAFTGIIQHIRSRVPVSLSGLRLDDTDRRALASINERKDSDATAASLHCAGYTITYRQLAFLSTNSWLNDQVINNYLQLLCEDVNERQQPPPQTNRDQSTKRGPAVPHSVASMGTHFYAKVVVDLAQSSTATDSEDADRLPPLTSSSATLRWFRRRQHLLKPFNAADPQSVWAVLIPVNIEAQHWALVVYYRHDDRWVLYDSMSRSDRARQRGLLILARLSHVWREAQRHYGVPVTGAAPVNSKVERDALLVAAAYAPWTAKEKSGTIAAASLLSPLDSLQPYGSIAELHRAAKRLRHQEEQLNVREGQCKGKSPTKLSRHEGAHRTKASLTVATTLPSSMLTDTEVEWFTDGFAHIPQQRNGNDCGVFVCQAAWCVAHGVAVSFTQTDVTMLRQVIALELLSTKLLRRYPTEHTSSSADV